MSGSTDPLLKSITVFLTDNEEDLLLRLGKCPNCRNSTLIEEEEMTAIQAAYSMGGMTIAASLYESENVEGVASTKYEETELSVSFAF